jgi:lipopolysaccharide assembly outer membrane protein LptD (OstA)
LRFIFHIILLPLFLFGLIGHSLMAQTNKSSITLGTLNDTIKTTIPPTENLKKQQDRLIQSPDLLLEPQDTVPTDSIKKPKGALDYIVDHKAESVKENFLKTLITLHDNAEINYGDLNIKAGHIEINHETNMVMATGIIDTTGYTQAPIVTQGGEESTHDSIRLNYKTEKAIAWGTKSELTGMQTDTHIMKKVNDSMIYIRDVIITTSDNVAPRDYHIVVEKGVMVPDKKIIGGKSQLYIAEVPTPVILPFAYFPLTQGRTSGIIMPSYGSTQAQGFFLQNGGYYLALNDYFDLALTGDLYTNGSWGMNAQSAYNVRYKYAGSFGLRYEKLYNSIRGFSDFGESSNYNIRWSHSQDTKANPNARFSTSVNLGSSTYYRQSLNESNSNAFLNNTLSSSISYQKRFVGTPFNLTSSMTHTQNTNTQSIDMSLPSLQVSMDRIYPFAPKDGTKKGMLQNIGTTYNFKGDYKINTTDEFFFKNEMFATARTGMQHDANLSTNTKIMKYFTLSPNARYKEVWYFDSVSKEYVPEIDQVVTDTISGFSSFREYNAGASLSTTLYGDFTFKKGNIEAIRHTMRPSVSYGYRPDFSYQYEEYQNSADPDDINEYNPFQNGIYGGPSKGISNSMGFTVANTLEAKVKSKDSTDLKPKKLSLIKNLNFSSNYNMAADSLKWSPISTNMGVSFFNNKLAVNIRAILDPYAMDVNGKKMDKFNIDNGGSLFRLTSAGLQTNYSFSSKSTKKDKKEAPKKDDTNSDGIFGEDMATTNESRSTAKNENDETKSTKIFQSRIPWDLKVAYAVNYSNNLGQNEFSSHSLMFSGDLELTPKWEMGFSSGYDFKNKGFTYTQLRFNRDLNSWRMSFNWVPFGLRTTYNFFIGIKSGIMSDLKYDQQKKPDQRLF